MDVFFHTSVFIKTPAEAADAAPDFFLMLI